MQEKFITETARNSESIIASQEAKSIQEHVNSTTCSQSLAALKTLQQSALLAKQSLREHEAQAKYSTQVFWLAKDFFDNLLFSANNELSHVILDELHSRTQRKFLFKSKLGENEICVLEERNNGINELHNEEKGKVLSLLWDLTLQKIDEIAQSVSATRKDTTMNIKKTSFNSSPFAQVGGAKSSKAYAANQVSATSSVNASESVTRGDTINVSQEGILRTEAYKVAQSSPDVRQQKIDAIKEQIATGTYKIDTKQLAFNLLKEEAVLMA